jgi:hypothetical protein
MEPESRQVGSGKQRDSGVRIELVDRDLPHPVLYSARSCRCVSKGYGVGFGVGGHRRNTDGVVPSHLHVPSRLSNAWEQ